MPLYGQQTSLENGSIRPRLVRNILNVLPNLSVAGTSDYQLFDRHYLSNLAQDFNIGGWAKAQGGTGTITYAENADGISENVISDVTVIGGYQFVSPSNNICQTLIAGHTYVLSVYVEATTGDLPEEWIRKTSGAIAISYGSGGFAGNPIAGNRYGIMFTAAESGIAALRIGVGSGVTTTAVGSLTVSKPMLQDITDFDNLDYFDDWQAPTYSARNHLPNCRFAPGETSGRIYKQSTPIPRDYTRTNLMGTWFGTGDSFAVSIGMWPDLLSTSTKYFVNAAGYLGHTTNGLITTRLAQNLAQYAFDGVILQGGINNIITGQTLATMQGYCIAEVAIVEAAGIATNKIIFINASGIKGSASWSAGLQAIQDTWNAWLLRYAEFLGAQYVDIYDALGDPADKRQLLAVYNNGDSIHPSAAGKAVIAEAVRAKMAIIEDNAVSYT